jgi:hypothetical protein
MGRDFLGTYDLFAAALLLFEPGVHDRVTEPVHCNGLDDLQLPRLLTKEALAKLHDDDAAQSPVNMKQRRMRTLGAIDISPAPWNCGWGGPVMVRFND